MSKKPFNPKETWQQFYKKSYVAEDAKRLENFTKVLSIEEKIKFDKDLKKKLGLIIQQQKFRLYGKNSPVIIN